MASAPGTACQSAFSRVELASGGRFSRHAGPPDGDYSDGSGAVDRDDGEAGSCIKGIGARGDFGPISETVTVGVRVQRVRPEEGFPGIAEAIFVAVRASGDNPRSATRDCAGTPVEGIAVVALRVDDLKGAATAVGLDRPAELVVIRVVVNRVSEGIPKDDAFTAIGKLPARPFSENPGAVPMLRDE